jgi:hypothetical protein
MTEYELLDLMGTWKANAAFAIMSLLLLLAAYLLMAYIAGRALPRGQAVIITALMLWFSGIIIAGIYTSLQTLIEIRELGLFGYSLIRRAIFFKWVITLGCALAPLACIKFMYHVRHPVPDRLRPRPSEPEV